MVYVLIASGLRTRILLSMAVLSLGICISRMWTGLMLGIVSSIEERMLRGLEIICWILIIWPIGIQAVNSCNIRILGNLCRKPSRLCSGRYCLRCLLSTKIRIFIWRWWKRRLRGTLSESIKRSVWWRRITMEISYYYCHDYYYLIIVH